jgi:hypothetical protein
VLRFGLRFLNSFILRLNVETQLILSVEHQGFKFEPKPDSAMTLLEHHSGGKVAEALRRALLATVEE